MIDTDVLIYNFKIHTILGKDPRVCFSLEAAKDIVDEIKERDAKIAHLERASLWLARQLWLRCPSSKTPKDCKFGRVNVDICSKCWTDYAIEREQ